MNKEISGNKTFEEIKHIDENGIEYWYARELQLVLEYKQWRRFEQVIDKAKEACKNSDINVFEHFADVGKLSKRANNAKVTINDYKLTRYACYRAPRTFFQTEKDATNAHYEVGTKVRKAIADIGGTMPENLPTPKKA